MTDVLAHRGPDDQGAYTADLHFGPAREVVPGVALGYRRLAIIDRAGGQQPLANEDGSVQLVFNGEIYNYRDLRRRLEGSGHRFRTRTDGETIVHLYEDEGTGAFVHLRGMFALALWDARKRQLVLARDRLGKKPLVYREEPGRLAFASELKALMEIPGAARDIDPAALDEYLTYGYVPHPGSIFRGVRKLPPATVAVWREGRLTVERYWSPDLHREDSRPLAEQAAQLADALREAVRLRLESEVPLGAFLSGGVDSAVVVALMRELSAERVKTFTLGFPFPEYDETAAAAAVAKHLGTEHCELRVEPQAVELLPKLAWHFDEPLADSSAIPTYLVSQLARQHVTVALTGDGGDELFGGYVRHRAALWGARFDRLPRWCRWALTAGPWQSLPGGRLKSRRERLKRFVRGLKLPAGRRYLAWVGLFDEAQRAALYTDDFLAALPESDPFDFLRHGLARADGRDPATAAGLTDLVTYLPCDLLAKVDTASMAVGLECRCPLLDHHVVELAAALPWSAKARGRQRKVILREAFGHLLPAGVWRRRKSGFGVPLDHWFRGELAGLARELLLDASTRAAGYFRPEAIERLLNDHSTGRTDHSNRLWALLFFETWRRQWTQTPVVST
jgi:asparagine synthase (glutamine-hydrolysing)